MHQFFNSIKLSKMNGKMAAGSNWQDLDLVFCHRDGSPINPRTYQVILEM